MFDPVITAHDLIDIYDKLPPTPGNLATLDTLLRLIPTLKPTTTDGADMLLRFGAGLNGFQGCSRTEAAFAAGVPLAAAMLAGAVPYDRIAVAAWATSVAEAADLDAGADLTLNGGLADILAVAEGVATYILANTAGR